MKDIIIKLLFAAVALALFTLMITSGLWNDAKSMDTKKDAQVTNVNIPSS